MTDETADELFRPSLADATPPQDSYHLYSGVLPAIFGGPVGVTVGMVLIARRLAAPAAVVAAIVATGVVGVVAVVVLATRVDLSSSTLFRLVGLVTAAAQLPMLVRRYRAWQVRGRDTASFWGPGLAATGIGVVVDLVIAANLGLLDTDGA